jgi:hypothetical protein
MEVTPLIVPDSISTYDHLALFTGTVADDPVAWGRKNEAIFLDDILPPCFTSNANDRHASKNYAILVDKTPVKTVFHIWTRALQSNFRWSRSVS